MLRPIPGFPGYAASSEGSIYRVLPKRRHPVTGRPIVAVLDKATGYLKVGVVSPTGVRVTRSVHSLVCDAFHGERPSGMDVRHVDGDRSHNEAANLEWGTRSENNLDKRRHGTSPMKTECIRGHVYDRDGVYIRSDGSRKCRPCALLNSAERREGKRQMVRD